MSQENNRPWWVSSGPPTTDSPKFEVPDTKSSSGGSNSQKSEEDEQKTDTGFDFSFLGVNPQMQAELLSSGINLLSAVIDVISKPLNGSEQTSTHDVQTCGICPLCLAVKTIREHDESLADLIESAMKGVTSSAEKLKEVWPTKVDSLTENIVSAVIKAMMKR